MASVLSWARRYVACGVSVAPVRLDGSKAPALGRGEIQKYREQYPTDAELCEWFDRPTPYGIAALGGRQSGNLAVLDFECRDGDDVYQRWLASLSPEMRAAAELLPLVRTPSGGYHLWARLPDVSPGGKFARYADGEMMIEVRGEDQYVVAPGSPADCHQTGRTYELLRKGWLSK